MNTREHGRLIFDLADKLDHGAFMDDRVPFSMRVTVDNREHEWVYTIEDALEHGQAMMTFGPGRPTASVTALTRDAEHSAKRCQQCNQRYSAGDAQRCMPCLLREQYRR